MLITTLGMGMDMDMAALDGDTMRPEASVLTATRKEKTLVRSDREQVG